MAKKSYHVVPKGGEWSVRSSGSSKASRVYSTQKEAIAKATDSAKKNGSELYIHGRDGRIRERNSYGRDPYPPKG